MMLTDFIVIDILVNFLQTSKIFFLLTVNLLVERFSAFVRQPSHLLSLFMSDGYVPFLRSANIPISPYSTSFSFSQTFNYFPLCPRYPFRLSFRNCFLHNISGLPSSSHWKLYQSIFFLQKLWFYSHPSNSPEIFLRFSSQAMFLINQGLILLFMAFFIYVYAFQYCFFCFLSFFKQCLLFLSFLRGHCMLIFSINFLSPAGDPPRFYLFVFWLNCRNLRVIIWLRTLVDYVVRVMFILIYTNHIDSGFCFLLFLFLFPLYFNYDD